MELHLSILDGVGDRYDTPYFNNLKQYSQKPVGTFHALPVARGKSVFRSHWIRDMGAFLRREPVPGRVLRHHRRARQPARAHRQHQAAQDNAAARLRRRARLLRHQRHIHLEQDRAPGAACAGRHRADRPQLPQVAPLRDGALRCAAAVSRGLPDDGLLDVRRGAAALDQEGAARAQGRGQARPGESWWTSPTAPSTATCTTRGASWRNASRSSPTSCSCGTRPGSASRASRRSTAGAPPWTRRQS